MDVCGGGISKPKVVKTIYFKSAGVGVAGERLTGDRGGFRLCVALCKGGLARSLLYKFV
jgi:hypothetical protein